MANHHQYFVLEKMKDKGEKKKKKKEKKRSFLTWPLKITASTKLDSKNFIHGQSSNQPCLGWEVAYQGHESGLQGHVLREKMRKR